MPASTIVASSGEFRLYGDSVQTFASLPVATYTIAFSQTTGYSLRQTEPLAPGKETVYGNHSSRVQRIINGYSAMDRSLGVILSGDKGMGKSLMIRLIAERMRVEYNLPTLLVQHDTPGLAAFLDELGEVVVVFDEFEKVFSDDEGESQNQFLSLFDGLSTTKRLYVLSVNELERVNDYMLNRPGRFHYHMRFAYPGPETVAAYLRDQVPGVAEKQVNEIVNFSRKYDINFDHLRAIAFELRLGESFAEVIGDLNIKRTTDTGSQVRAHITWEDGGTDVLVGRVDLFDNESLQTISDWESGTGMRFRMRDAVTSEDGYRLPPGAFTFIDVRDGEDKSPDDEPTRRAVSVTLRRPPKYSIDF
ncbi:AAA family ATPase [Streptomyces sp. NBC_01768]|uniref:AAA family ATPase n=1 Tax=Streptomyces sp. NBC_01768 TaxID=2975938 RepID=UPI002DDAC0E4|nr:AAA family ATPase [Streptomyces sp. NBC_01768]WSC32330.1 ATP-binding protein [Streptomyces sp. NBC_01768]